jgi:hypothetical protein
MASTLTPDIHAVTSILADRFAPLAAQYKDDPALWAHERLGDQLWSKQVEIMQSVVEHRRTAVRSCHGVGKSFSAARLICWWIDTHPLGEAFVVSTAPSNEQVEAVLWREINKAAQKAEERGTPLPGRMLIREWKIGNELVGYGRKPADYNPTAFQGIHARYVLVILDEACGIPEQLWTAAGALITNDDSRILAIGNPDDPTSHFFNVCQEGSSWNSLRIQATDSPNFTGEKVTRWMSQVLVSPQYLEDLKDDGCGPGTPIWSSKVEGEFPIDAEDVVVRPSTVARCRLPEQRHDVMLPVELGIDVGGGGDISVIMLRRGPVASLIRRDKQPDTMKLVGYILEAIDQTGATKIKVDKTGIGTGVVDRLNEHRSSGRITCEVVGIMTGAGSSKPQRFPKLRDEIWWDCGRRLSENGEWDLSQMEDTIISQLCATRYAPDSSGRIKVEFKAETKKRIGRSPDDADALLLAFWGGASSAFKEWMEELAPICPRCSMPNPAGTAVCSHCFQPLAVDADTEVAETAPTTPQFSLGEFFAPNQRPTIQPDPMTQKAMEMLQQLQRQGNPNWWSRGR